MVSNTSVQDACVHSGTNTTHTDIDIKTTLLTNFQDIPLDRFEEFMTGIQSVLFDCDGVLWIENTPLKNAQALVLKLRQMGKKVFFVTNNSTKTRPEFLVKFNQLGFEATLDEIVSSSFLVALYLTEKKIKGRVYVIGTPGIVDELKNVGIECLPIGPEEDSAALDAIGRIKLEKDVEAVVVGFDNFFNYTKLTKAASYLNNPNVHFIATNTDERFPTATDLVVPGTGAIVNAVRTAAEREPEVMGKPSLAMFEHIARLYNLDPAKALMVGDRGNTDILFGRNCNLWTLLVLTGVTSLDETQGWKTNGTEEQKKCVPHFYLNEIGDLYDLIEKSKL